MPGAQHYFGCHEHPALFGAGCPQNWGVGYDLDDEEIEEIIKSNADSEQIKKKPRPKFGLIDGKIQKLNY